MTIVDVVGAVLWLAVGMTTWTLLEYVLHGQLFHPRRPRNHFAKEHALHHATPSYIAGWPTKLAALAAVVTLLVLALRPTIGVLNGSALAAGLAVMYLSYEGMHRIIHSRAPRTAYGRSVRLHHVLHHFHTPRRNFGVTSNLWDRVFGTYDAIQTPLAVPERLALPWMIDPASGGLRPEFAADYVLVRRVRSHDRVSAVPPS